ncbi:flavin reductase family protein [Rhodoflexus caldus]|uniref:flavin reductase family protein n=1 Tax=Rhodoflexus caldus TaxID=2891236 RepID=UPI002029CD0F|nr:flavin reductase family protein [Rhodoflexus caldus]
MKTIRPADIPTVQMHALMLSSIGPRPIAFASTVSRDGQVNLSPFSFFNCVGSNPPILVFSPARRVRDNTIKHTLENVYEVPEVVINIVNHDIVEQMSLASTEYEKGVNEFVKSGLTELASEMVRPPRVKESPVQYECKVRRIIPLGNQGGAGNLIICEIVLAHFREDIFDSKGQIDPFKLDLVSRMGGDWYCRANGNALFEVAKPVARLGIGVDNLPEAIRLSPVLTGNHLGKLGNTESLPDPYSLAAVSIPAGFEHLSGHHLAAALLDANLIDAAWKVLLAS